MTHCETCQVKDKRIKVLEADLEFQFRKMQEDLAAEKVTQEMAFQKESKKLMEKYIKEKTEREEENKKWITKYDQTVQKYEKMLINAKEQYVLQMKIEQNKLQAEIALEQKHKIENYEKSISSLRQEIIEQSNRITSKSKKQLEKLTKINEETIQKVTTKLEEEIKQVKNAGQEKTSLLLKDWNLEKQMHQKTKLEFKTIQKQLHEQIFSCKSEMYALNNQINALNNEIKQKNEYLRLKNIQIEELHKDQNVKLNDLSKKLLAQKQQLQNEYKERIATILQKEMKDFQKFEKAVQEIQDRRTAEIKLYETNLHEVKYYLQTRPSKSEDTQEINQLRSQLYSKELELECMIREARSYKLQLQNKEQTFNKIFTNQAPHSGQLPLSIESIGKRRDSSKVRRNSGKSASIKELIQFSSLGNAPPVSTTPEEGRKKRGLPQTSKVL